MMSENAIFWPVLLNILLVIILYVALAKAKKVASAAGQVDEQRRALHSDAWPESVQKINNCIANQFEAPMLFYILAFVLWALNGINALVLILAWGFVGLRYAHAYVHTHSNNVPVRRRLFTLSTLLLLVLWLVVAWRLL